MQYKYFVVYKLTGIMCPESYQDKVLIEYPEINAKAFLTHDIDNHVRMIDEVQAIRSLILKGIFSAGQVFTEKLSEDSLAKEVNEIKERRKKRNRKKCFCYI